MVVSHGPYYHTRFSLIKMDLFNPQHFDDFIEGTGFYFDK
jgi:hypothetical protein